MKMTKAQFDLLVQKIEEIVLFTVNSDFSTEDISVSNDSYINNDRDDLSEAWEDFKRTNNQLKEAGIYTKFDDNETPSYDFTEWTLYIDVPRSIYVIL